MATQDRDTLKSYFESGDKPTQAQFEDLIDSAINLSEDPITILSNSVNIGGIDTEVSSFSTSFTGNFLEIDSVITEFNGILVDIFADLTLHGPVFGLPADYGEYFESENGKGIEVGTAVVVVVDSGKIRPAQEKEIPIGIVSANPLIAGNHPSEWPGKYLRDELGRFIMEPHEDNTDKEIPEEEQTKSLDKVREAKRAAIKAAKGDREAMINQYRSNRETGKKGRKLNPEYDPTRTYIPRKDREEWCCVGLLGQLPLYKNQSVAPGWIKLREISPEADMWLVK